MKLYHFQFLKNLKFYEMKIKKYKNVKLSLNDRRKFQKYIHI